MYRIRFHGRGGQGMRTASRILGTAFFLEGFEVQDAPRYGAERRGAPIFAYVRADSALIHERGIISRPDLVIVADDSLVPIPAAGVMAGITKKTCLLINSRTAAGQWKERLQFPGKVLTMESGGLLEDPLAFKFIGVTCAGAAAGLIAALPKDSLQQAIRTELSGLDTKTVTTSLDHGENAFDQMTGKEGMVVQGEMMHVRTSQPPSWIRLPFEGAHISAPAIHAAATSEQLKTGLWRTMRPVIDHARCNRCWWLCSTFCPDGTISVDENRYPRIDYDHCKGCMVCLAQCPAHAIEAVPEGRSS